MWETMMLKALNEFIRREDARRKHAKSILPQHLNKSKLHLNRKGSSILTGNFVKALSHAFD